MYRRMVQSSALKGLDYHPHRNTQQNSIDGGKTNLSLVVAGISLSVYVPWILDRAQKAKIEHVLWSLFSPFPELHAARTTAPC